jgi:hypothetical protein
MLTGLSVSATAAVPPATAARRRRSRHAVTFVCPRPSQYSGGRPGPAARAAGCWQPGYLHMFRVAVAWLSLVIVGSFFGLA